MKKTLMSLTLVLVLCLTLVSCGGSNGGGDDNKGMPRIAGGGMASVKLLFDISFSEGKDALIEELYMSDSAIYPADVVGTMEILTGLSFAVNITFTDGAFTIEWTRGSDLFKDFADVQLREEFHFNNAEALRWFMLDSMWRTLGSIFDIGDIYYITNHVHDSVVEPSPFDYNTPYKGSPFYSENRVIQGADKIYSDEPYYLDGVAEADSLSADLVSGDFAFYDTKNSAVHIYGFEIVGDKINVIIEVGENAGIAFTVTIVDRETLKRDDTGEIFKRVP